MSMNIFRLLGDMTRASSILILLYQVTVKNHAKSISVRFLEASLVVSLARYLDLFTTFYSFYNSAMKMFFISSELCLILAIRFQEDVNSTYDKARDCFPHWQFVVAPSFVISIVLSLFNGIDDPFEMLWMFSIVLESVSVLPQLALLKRYRQVEPFVDMSVFCRGMYRFFYILNWIYRAHTERNYRHHYIVYVCGVVQTVLYFKFFYRLIKGGILCKIVENCFKGGSSGGEEGGDGSGLTELLLEETNDANIEVPESQPAFTTENRSQNSQGESPSEDLREETESNEPTSEEAKMVVV